MIRNYLIVSSRPKHDNCRSLWQGLALAVAATVVAVGPARADGIVLEAHVIARQPEAESGLNAIRAALTSRGIEANAKTLMERLSPHLPVMSPLTSADTAFAKFSDNVEQGHRLWIKAQFNDAVTTLAPLVELAISHPDMLIADQRLRNDAHRAMVDLALLYQRLGNTADSEAVIGNVVRSFPDLPVSRGKHGPEAYSLYERVKTALEAQAKATIVIDGASGYKYWVNEQPVPDNGRMAVIPGPCRVVAERGDTRFLANIVVPAGETFTVVLDPGFTSSVHIDASWVGLVFADNELLRASTPAMTRRLGQLLNADQVVTLSVDNGGDKPRIMAKTAGGKPGNRQLTVPIAALAANASDAADIATELADYLMGGAVTARLRDLDAGRAEKVSLTPELVSPKAQSSAGKSLSPWKWIIGGLGLATSGLGVYLLSVDGTCAVKNAPNTACPTFNETTKPGWGAVAGGGALVLTSIIMFAIDAGRPSPVAVEPTDGGAVVMMRGAF